METGTGLMWADRTQGDLSITEWAFVPMGMDAPVLVQILQVENTGSSSAELSDRKSVV